MDCIAYDLGCNAEASEIMRNLLLTAAAFEPHSSITPPCGWKLAFATPRIRRRALQRPMPWPIRRMVDKHQ